MPVWPANLDFWSECHYQRGHHGGHALPQDNPSRNRSRLADQLAFHDYGQHGFVYVGEPQMVVVIY